MAPNPALTIPEIGKLSLLYNAAMTDVTRLLIVIEEGDTQATDKLLPLVYQELRKLASVKLSKEAQGQSLQPTMLVHDAYLRLVDVEDPQEWQGRGHFFAAAAEAMRRILVERARRKRRLKLGGHLQRVELHEPIAEIESPVEDLLVLDEALNRLEKRWPEKAKLVKLKYFAGLTIAQVAEAMKISTATAERHWKFARVWLHSEIHGDR